jgi:hypothetical protein
MMQAERLLNLFFLQIFGGCCSIDRGFFASFNVCDLHMFILVIDPLR